ncbi:adenine deaminase C-terminal domain-containing protein [endosymbiont 'TC1' of Trimyema compressum]|uniref:adenine deaminase C-terminal domain-containing protein n=1 Tax=endosymbiont 'TC1' of Trimyema compressum TaxID=243899 RepID=UPI000B4C7CA0|nr:adenine deaminase C-terminal domain-containing protein [endosymbiont 'TC1' of Trimyema compressum]
MKDGVILEEYEGKSLNRISIVQRYKHNKKRHIVNGYMIGIHIDEGAIATSFPAPVSYLIGIGENCEEILGALKSVDNYSGACVVMKVGLEEAVLTLEIYGMMSNASADDFEKESIRIDEVAEKLGYKNEGEPIINKLLSMFIFLHRFGFMKE